MEQETREHLKRYGKFALIGLVIALFFLTLPAVQAVELTALQVPAYSFDAPAGNVIYQIIVDQMPMGSNQTHTLTVGSATYFLSIQSSNPYGIYYDFDIAWTMPNGTTQNLHKSITRLPGAGYKTNIQPVFTQAESAYFVVWTIDLQIGTTNQSVSADINTGPAGWSPSDALPFTSAAGEFGGSSTNVYLYTMTTEDYTTHVVTYDPAWGLQNLGNTVFQWGWNSVLGFINQIPIIGPQFASILLILGSIIQEFVFWLVWILQNLPMIIAGLEVTICMLAVSFAGKNPKAETVAKNIFNYNIAVFSGFIWMFNQVYTWTIGFIKLITDIIQALKPT